jgi:hypothetical protein
MVGTICLVQAKTTAPFSPPSVRRLQFCSCDALVWAFSELMVEPMAGQGFYDLARERAEALEGTPIAILQ